MKELDELYLPEDLGYTDDHEWARITGETVRIGVSDYARISWGISSLLNCRPLATALPGARMFGTLESVKAVSELYMPMSGEVVAINAALTDSPELINQDPYAAWIIEIKPSDPGEFARLHTAAGYLEMLKDDHALPAPYPRRNQRDARGHRRGQPGGLFATVPAECRMTASWDLPQAKSEWQLNDHLRLLAASMGVDENARVLIGAGSYRHHIPETVRALASRSEFLTAYTPYQPEMAQGTLQASSSTRP
jgi:glycine cleavage system H protein